MKKAISFAIAFALIGQNSTAEAQSSYDAAKSRARARSEANAKAAAAARSQAEKALVQYKLCSQYVERNMEAEGKIYCENAAKFGNVDAAILSASIIAKEMGTLNNQKSLYYFQLGAQRGNKKSAYYSGLIYLMNENVALAVRNFKICFDDRINDTQYAYRVNEIDINCTYKLLSMVKLGLVTESDIGLEKALIKSVVSQPTDDLDYGRYIANGFSYEQLSQYQPNYEHSVNPTPFSGRIRYTMYLMSDGRPKLCWLSDGNGNKLDNDLEGQLCSFLKKSLKFKPAVNNIGNNIESFIRGDLDLSSNKYKTPEGADDWKLRVDAAMKRSGY